MTSTSWIPVVMQQQPLWEEEAKDRGVLVSYRVSPHDVPRAVRGSYNTQLDRFIIELRYLDNEETLSKKVDDFVVLRIGKNSRRLLGIELDTKKMGVETVGLHIQEAKLRREEALGKLSDAVERFEESANLPKTSYVLALQALRQKKEELMPECMLAGAC
jgi:hypothetical protein